MPARTRRPSGQDGARSGGTPFEQAGGFDESAALHYIEDIEIGWRLRQQGSRIRLDRTLLSTHRKCWRLRDMLRTDILLRARPWSRLILQGASLVDDLNLKWSQRLAVALSTGGVALLPVGLMAPPALLLSALAFGGAIALNAPLFRSLWTVRGLGFAVCCAPLHVLHHASSAAGFAIACYELRVAPWISRVGRVIAGEAIPPPDASSDRLRERS